MAETAAGASETAQAAGPVVVAVDNSDDAMDPVVEAAHEAARRGAPLEITVVHLPSSTHGDPRRAHLMQRLDQAVELARSVVPGLEVRLPVDNPLEDDVEGLGGSPIPPQRDAGAPPRGA